MTTLPGETGAGGAPASTGDGGPPAVHVRGLVKAYSGVRAVNGIDLDIRRGEIFALLGPNGAGKTTTVEILEGYKHFADGMQAGFLGTAFHWTDVLVVAAWGLAGLALAMRFFSWEPPGG